MNPSQLINITFKVFYKGEMKKQRQVTVFFETAWGSQKGNQGPGWKRKWKKQSKVLGTNQCAYCKKEGHWKRERLKNSDKNVLQKDRGCEPRKMMIGKGEDSSEN